MITRERLYELAGCLKDGGNRYAILIHRHPDGDAVCSAVALGRILSSLGKQFRICCADAVPRYLEKLCPFAVETDPVFEKDELLLSVDVAEPSLFGSLSERVMEKGVYAKIDHHRTGTDFALYNFVDPVSSAAGEIVLMLAYSLNVTDNDTLLACYGAIASDTGGFRYANTTASAFAAAGDMKARGISFEQVNSILFESKDRRTLQATAYGVSKTEFCFDGRAALCAVSRLEMDQQGFSDENLSELGSALREIEGVCIAAVLREEKQGGSFRLSTRSDKNADCIALCSAFGGGGHLRAAGATVIAENKEMALNLVRKELEKQFSTKENK